MQTWHQAIGAEKQQPYFQYILETVRAERLAGKVIYPPAQDVLFLVRILIMVHSRRMVCLFLYGKV